MTDPRRPPAAAIGPHPVPPRPEGSTLDHARLVAVATETNAPHKAMATELVVLDRHGVTLAVPWRDDLVEAPGRGLARGVLAALLDHACSLAAVLSLDSEERFAGTMGLRIDYLGPTEPGQPIHARADCLRAGGGVAFVRGAAFHPDRPEHPVAEATCTCAVAP